MERKPRKEVEIPKDRHKNPIHKELNLSTDLNKDKKHIMVSFKNMEVIVVEIKGDKTTTISKDKYILGDIALQRYCSKVREYIHEGYENVKTVSNMEEVLKKVKNKIGVEKDDL